MKLYTLGTSHGGTEKNRSCSGNLLEVNGKYYLFDCGGDVERKMCDMELPFENLEAVFISHMHEDHVGKLSSIVKRFSGGYMKVKKTIKIFLPEESAIVSFENWLSALHLPSPENVAIFGLVLPGEVYKDENIRVQAIATRHIEEGKYPSYAYLISSADRKMVYTGDLSWTFGDYPEIILKEKTDAVLCELVHFDLDKHFDMINRSKTSRLIFTHIMPNNISKFEKAKDKFNFDACVAEDGMCFEI